MIWVQGGVSFLFWITYGVIQSRRSDAIRDWALSVPRKGRILQAITLMFVSILVLFAVLVTCLKNNGFGASGMTSLTWLLVTVFGMLFVHGQTLSTALLVATMQESVTASRLQSSSKHTTQEIHNDEASPS